MISFLSGVAVGALAAYYWPQPWPYLWARLKALFGKKPAA